MYVFIEKGEVEMLCTSEMTKDWAEFAKTLLQFVKKPSFSVKIESM